MKDRVQRLLQRIEWRGFMDPTGHRACPSCAKYQEQGEHREDCELSSLLQELKDPAKASARPFPRGGFVSVEPRLVGEGSGPFGMHVRVDHSLRCPICRGPQFVMLVPVRGVAVGHCQACGIVRGKSEGGSEC